MTKINNKFLNFIARKHTNYIIRSIKEDMDMFFDENNKTLTIIFKEETYDLQALLDWIFQWLNEQEEFVNLVLNFDKLR